MTKAKSADKEREELRDYLQAFSAYLPGSNVRREKLLRELVWSLFELVGDGRPHLYMDAWSPTKNEAGKTLKYEGFRALVVRLRNEFEAFNSKKTYDGPTFTLRQGKIVFDRIDAALSPTTSIRQRLHERNLRLAGAARLEAATDSDLYVPRRDVEKELSQFLKSDKQLFVLIGKSGSGKSTTACRLALECPQTAILLLGNLHRTTNLEFPSAVDQMLGDIEIEDSNRRSGAPDTQSLGDKSCLMVVDALESALDPAITLESITSWLCSPAAHEANVKVLLTCAHETWVYLTQQREIAVPHAQLFTPMATARTERNHVTHSSRLADYSDSELTKALKVHAKHCGVRASVLAKHREILRNPYLLHLAASLVARDSSALSQQPDNNVLSVFWSQRILSGPSPIGDATLGFATSLLETQQESAPERSIRNESWYDAAAFRRLLDDSVLMRVECESGHRLSFSHPRLLVHALAQSFSSFDGKLDEALDGYLKATSFYTPLPQAIAESLRYLSPRKRQAALKQIIAHASEPNGSFLMGCVFAQLAPLSRDDLQALGTFSTSVGIECVSALIRGVAHIVPDQSLRMLEDIVGATDLSAKAAANLSMTFASFPQTAFTASFRATLCEWRDGNDETLRIVATYPYLDRLFAVGMTAEAFAALGEMSEEESTGVRIAAAAHTFSALWADASKALPLVERFASDDDADVVNIAAMFVARYLSESPGALDEFRSWALPKRKQIGRFFSAVDERCSSGRRSKNAED